MDYLPNFRGYADGGDVDGDYDSQMSSLDMQARLPWNWGNDAQNKIAYQRVQLRDRMARMAAQKAQGLWGAPKAMVPPEKRAEGGPVGYTSNVPEEWYGGRHPGEQLGFTHGGEITGYAYGGPISDDVLNAVRSVESGGNPNAVSPKGALGAFQFMPATARDLGIDPLDPAQARSGAHQYLSQLYDQTGSLENALAAYNWGLGNLKKYGKENMPLETKNYISRVLARLGKAQTGQPDTLVSQPHNKADPVPPPQPQTDSGSNPTQAQATPPVAPPPAPSGSVQSASATPIDPTAVAGVLGRARAQPSMNLGAGTSALNMVDKLLKDPLSLARG